MPSTRKTPRVLIAAIAVAALTLAWHAAPPVEAAGLTNCVELFGRAGACYEPVWANGVQVRMTFPKEALPFTGATPDDRLGNFYVLAPQVATPQGALPFPHDHVVGNAPSRGAGSYVVHLRGFFVLCSAAGLASGGCVPTMTTIPGLGLLPFARTVDGQPLTSADAIESAANAGLLTPVDTQAVFVAVINPGP